MTLDLPGRHASRVHGDDLLVEARKPPLIPGDQLRVERAFPIARNTQVQLGILGQHRLLRIAIAVIGLARRRLAIEMVVQFRVQDALGQRFLQLVESPSLENTSFGSRPDKSSSNVPFLIAIARLLRLHYGPTHKIPDSPRTCCTGPLGGTTLAHHEAGMNVTDWLDQLGLPQYRGAFAEHQIDAEVLKQLTSEDLKELGVGLLGHRRKLLSAIEALRTANEQV